MKFYLVAIGKRMPEWVSAGYYEYARRMKRECTLELIEVAAKKRSEKTDMKRLLREEGEALLAAIPKRSIIIALDRKGKTVDTRNIADSMTQWLREGTNVCYVDRRP